MKRVSEGEPRTNKLPSLAKELHVSPKALHQMVSDGQLDWQAYTSSGDILSAFTTEVFPVATVMTFTVEQTMRENLDIYPRLLSLATLAGIDDRSAVPKLYSELVESGFNITRRLTGGYRLSYYCHAAEAERIVDFIQKSAVAPCPEAVPFPESARRLYEHPRREEIVNEVRRISEGGKQLGAQSETARRLGISKQAVFNALRTHHRQTGEALTLRKRK